MSFTTLLLVCFQLQLSSSQPINESEMQYTAGLSSATHTENVEEASETDIPVKQIMSPTTLTTAVSKTMHREHESSSINPKMVTMERTKKTISTNTRTSKSFIFTTALATTIADLDLTKGVLANLLDSTLAVSMTTDPIQQSTSAIVTSTDWKPNNIWYISDDGTDDNDCHSTSAPCRNLQTVLDRAADGADIYVTSDTLSIDGQTNGISCWFSSSLSYTISHLDNKLFTFTCSEYRIKWNVYSKMIGLASVTLNNASFSKEINFHLEGLININYCSLKGKEAEFTIYNGLYETRPTAEDVKSFKSFVANRTISIFKSKFDVNKVIVRITGTARELQISHSDLNCEMVIICSSEFLTLFSLNIQHGSVSHSRFLIKFKEKISFIYISIINVNMVDVLFAKFDHFGQGKLGFHVENSTWVNNDSSFIILYEVISVNIVSSQLTVNCQSCLVMNVYGIGHLAYGSSEFYFLKSMNYPGYIAYENLGLYTFRRDQGSILSINTTILKMQGNLLDKFDLNKVAIALRDSTFLTEGRISFYVWKYFITENIVTQCLTGQMTQRIMSENEVIYACNPSCEGKLQYSLQAGSMMVSEEVHKASGHDYHIEEVTTPKIVTNVTTCIPCPLGADCEDFIKALPNYWGYVTPMTSVSIVRCPDGYCCQNNETCSRIDSCNTGRTGTLCGTCEENLTEALFAPKCIPNETCRSDIVITFFNTSALLYAVVLLSFSAIKTKFTKMLKRFYLSCKGKFQRDKVTDKPSQKSSQYSEKDQNDFKYIQILLYYVQDSKLFIVSLPESNPNTSNLVVQFLEFSPVILKVYMQTTELCFALSSAVVKIVLQFSFGFVVMLFIFIVYLIQRMLLKLFPRKLDCAEVNGKLVQAFILTVLFSYQKIVIGAFALVQCVEVNNQTILFLQGDIECYTWWQICTLVYICITVFPIFIVLAHAPFCVKDKKMSVRAFILACLFPLPVMVWCNIANVWKRCATKDNERKPEGLDMVECEAKYCAVDTAKEIVERETSFNKGDFSDKLQSETKHEKSVLGVAIEEELGSAEEAPENSAPMFSETSQNVSDEQKSNIIWTKQLVVAEGSKSDEIVSTDSLHMEASIRGMEGGCCEEDIVNSLLKHYKCISVLGIRFTWLGVHKIYRVILVAFKTFITEPVAKMYAMSTLVMVMTAVNAMIQPYKDKRANRTATLSYIANLGIAVISLIKAHLVAFGCDTSCHFRDIVVGYMGTVEDALLLYLPLSAMGLWVVFTGLQKCFKKK